MKVRITREMSLPLTWAEIKETINRKPKAAEAVLPPGATIEIALKDGRNAGLDVARDKHGKVFFVFRDIYFSRPMNPTQTSRGGWMESSMRKCINTEMLDLLPDDLQEAISWSKIMESFHGSLFEMGDKLFLLSKTQVFGGMEDPEIGETQLDIFPDDRSRVKQSNGETRCWWLRSVHGAATFDAVNAYGSDDNECADFDCGVVLAFCL